MNVAADARRRNYRYGGLEVTVKAVRHIDFPFLYLHHQVLASYGSARIGVV
jgi:hypothetical protein